MDACTIAVRLGAQTVTCVYRRTQSEMTGYPSEYDHCIHEGVRFRWLTQPVRAVAGDGGNVSALECVDVTLGDIGADGRPHPSYGTDTFSLAADHVLVATGQSREPGVFEQLGVSLDGARPRTDGFATSHPKVFAGGDAVLTGKELSVVDAVAQGRDAAIAIDLFLAGVLEPAVLA
jgi:glutamate synthase (NADPH/NADH) small chain